MDKSFNYYNTDQGHSLRFQRTGDSDNLLIIVSGGPGLTFEYLQPFHDNLAKSDFSVITYDCSGTASTDAPYLLSIEEYATELNEFINFLNPKAKVHIAGHSFGGAILQQFLIDYPNVADRAILINSFSSGKQLKSEISKRVASFPAEFHEKYKEFEKNENQDILWELIEKYWFPRHFMKFSDINEDILISLGNNSKAAVGAYYIGDNLFDINGAVMKWDVHERLSEIETPIVVMSGEFDYFSKEASESVVNKLNNAELWFSSQSSHMPMYEDVDAFFTAIKNFIKA